MPDELLHTNKVDCEIWRAGDQTLFVARPRLLSIMAMAWWITLAAFAWFTIVMSVVMVSFLGGSSGGFWVAMAVIASLGVWFTTRSLRARKVDRAIKATPIRELSYVVVDRATSELVDPDGARWPLADVRVATGSEDMDEYTRHELYLVWGDQRRLIFHAPRQRKLDPVRALLGDLGIGDAPTKASP